MTKSKLLAQGSYGCVYYPGYMCNGKKKENKYVSKLARNDKSTQVEYDIGKLVKKIPNYNKRFIVIEKKCKIKQNKIDSMKEGCEFIKKKILSFLYFTLFKISKIKRTCSYINKSRNKLL